MIVTKEDYKKHVQMKEELKKMDLSKLKETARVDLYKLLSKKEEIFRKSILTWEKYYGELSEFPIELYPKQRIFFELGNHFKIRALSGGNRSSKSFSQAEEASCHALNWYPSWWKGKRFSDKENLTIVCISDDYKTSRDVIQSYFLQESKGAELGTGFIPHSEILWDECKKLSKDTYEYIVVKRQGGGKTTILFKSSKVGRKLFQGFKADYIWFDEEPPQEVFEEALVRTTTTNGLIAITYTPLSGVTPFIKQFLDNEYSKFCEYKEDNIIFMDKYKERKNRPSMVFVRVGWDDIPHLTEEQKRETLDGIPEWQWDARIRGIPVLGAGAIYPFMERDIVCESFDIPEHWNKWYGLDVGTVCTAVSLMCEDPVSKVVYVYGEMTFKNNNGVLDYLEPILDEVTPYRNGAIDHAANMKSQVDARSIRKMLSNGGLTLVNANKSVVEGLTKVYRGFKQRNLKIFDTCVEHLNEFRIYHRNDKGELVKEHDHHMDAMRYAFMMPENLRSSISTMVTLEKRLEEVEEIERIMLAS